MAAMVGLLLMLLRVSHGVETRCDGRKDGALCYGALGGSLDLQLMDDASEIPRYEWKNETTTILRGRKSRIITNNIEQRSVFTPTTGTLKIKNLNRNDGSNYTFTLYDEENRLSGSRTLTLSIQAPVSSVHLEYNCLSLGEKRVSCSVKRGDGPQYRWTLDGRTLTEDELLPGSHETNSVTLKLQVVGQLVCWVHNHISNVSVSVELTTCGFIFINCTLSNGTEISQWVHEASNTLCVPPTTVSTTSVGKETGTGSITPSNNITSFNQTVTASSDEQWYICTLSTLAGVLAALVILVAVAIAITCHQNKKQRNKTKVEEDDDQELTYADVRIVQQRARQEEHRSDMGVEYGQVKFSERPRQTDARNDDCVYSQVRGAR